MQYFNHIWNSIIGKEYPLVRITKYEKELKQKEKLLKFAVVPQY